ncbi:hypothetical protein Tco_0504699 [Tanacetum coccineum]
MDLNAFIRTADPRKVRIVERPRTENEGPIVIVAKHRTVTLLPNFVLVRPGVVGVLKERLGEMAACLAKMATGAEYNILEKMKWRSLAEEKDSLFGGEDKEIEELRSQLLKAQSQNQGLVSQVHELETSSARLRERLDLYEGNMKRLEEFQDNLMRPLETRLAEIDADFTRRRRWLLTHGMKLLMAKFPSIDRIYGGKCSRKMHCGPSIEKECKEGLAARIEHGQVGRCLTDLEAYIPPRRVEKMERNLVERLHFLKDVFVSLDHHLSAEALTEPPVEVPATNALSTVVIVPHSGPSVSVEDYENPDLVGVVPKNVTLGPEGEENIDASTGGDPAFSKLENETMDVVL